MGFTAEQYGAPLAAVLNSLQAIRRDEFTAHHARMRERGIPDAEYGSPFVAPVVGTLAEADALSLHYYQYSFGLCGSLQANAHGLADAMCALGPGADMTTVRRLLYALAQRTAAADVF